MHVCVYMCSVKMQYLYIYIYMYTHVYPLPTMHRFEAAWQTVDKRTQPGCIRHHVPRCRDVVVEETLREPGGNVLAG